MSDKLSRMMTVVSSAIGATTRKPSRVNFCAIVVRAISEFSTADILSKELNARQAH